MVKVVVIEETREVYVYIDGKEIKGDELEYISPNKDFIKLFKEYEYGATDDPVDALASYLLEKGGITVEVGKSYKI